MKTTLLIMAAGIGSRFGTGIKQLEPVDDVRKLLEENKIGTDVQIKQSECTYRIR